MDSKPLFSSQFRATNIFFLELARKCFFFNDIFYFCSPSFYEEKTIFLYFGTTCLNVNLALINRNPPGQRVHSLQPWQSAMDFSLLYGFCIFLMVLQRGIYCKQNTTMKGGKSILRVPKLVLNMQISSTYTCIKVFQQDLRFFCRGRGNICRFDSKSRLLYGMLA